MLGSLPSTSGASSSGRPAAIGGQQPESGPHAGAGWHLGSDFEIAVGLREAACRREPAGSIGQAGRSRNRTGGDIQHAVRDAERAAWAGARQIILSLVIGRPRARLELPGGAVAAGRGAEGVELVVERHLPAGRGGWQREVLGGELGDGLVGEGDGMAAAQRQDDIGALLGHRRFDGGKAGIGELGVVAELQHVHTVLEGHDHRACRRPARPRCSGPARWRSRSSNRRRCRLLRSARRRLAR